MTLAPARILVRGPNWLGDLAMSTPGFRALRAAFPESHIALHVREGLLPLLRGAPWFDELRAVRSFHAGWASLVDEARSLRRDGPYDLGICIPDSWSSALLMRAAGVRQLVGHQRAGRGLLLHRAVRTSGRVARERHVLELTEEVGAPAVGTQLELFTTPEEEARGRELLSRHDVDLESGCVGLAPGASFGPSKQWPVESFARVGDAAAERGMRVLILGAPGEEELAQRVLDAMTRPAVTLAGALDLGVLKSVIRGLRVLVCNDAGARHVAVAFGVPCSVIFGPTSVEKTNWNLERVQVLETDVSCRPCYERVCPIDHRCMTRLAPERVIASVDAFLTRRGGNNAGT